MTNKISYRIIELLSQFHGICKGGKSKEPTKLSFGNSITLRVVFENRSIDLETAKKDSQSNRQKPQESLSSRNVIYKILQNFSKAMMDWLKMFFFIYDFFY